MLDGRWREATRRTLTGWPAKVGRWMDDVITATFPAWGFRRARYRAAMTILSAYRGADRSRLYGDWVPQGGSADADLLPELASLRERSRDLNRSDAHAAAITNTVTVNTVGSGIRPQSRVNQRALRITPQLAREFEFAAERAWQAWYPYADAQGRMDFYEIQTLVQRQILENGEVLILPLMIKDEAWRRYRLALEVIEADRLQTPTDLLSRPDIRDGIELGARGQPLAYWIRKRHPGDLYLAGSARPSLRESTATSDNFIRYEAINQVTGRRNLLHLYWVRRPGQSRGEPFFAPVLTYFKDLADVVEAERVAARVAACFVAFVKKTDPMAAATQITTAVNAQGQRLQELEPGVIDYLAPGEDVTFANPNRPGGTFEPFVLMILRQIGAALGLPLELILKDFSRTNYSSARAALLEARRFFKSYQHWLAVRLCQPVWEMLLEEAWLTEDLPAVNILGPERSYWMSARWIAPGWGWVDPVKEVQSSELAIQNNLSTLADECAAQGRDWEEVLEQRQREQEKQRELGLESRVPPPAAGPPDAGPSDQSAPQEETDSGDEMPQALTAGGAYGQP